MCSLSVCLGERTSEERAERERKRELRVRASTFAAAPDGGRNCKFRPWATKGVEGSRSAGLGRYDLCYSITVTPYDIAMGLLTNKGYVRGFDNVMCSLQMNIWGKILLFESYAAVTVKNLLAYLFCG